MAEPSFAPFVLGALVFLVVAAVALWLAHQRRKAFEEVAQRLGLEFVPDAGRPDATLRAFDVMSQGSSRRILNELRGTYKGRRVRCFDFRYSTGSGKNRSTHHRGVVLVEVPPEWPRLNVVPEHLGHKLADALGAEDVDFESQEFSDRFWVRAADRRFAYDVIHPRMMEFLMEPGVQRWELREGWLCAWDTSRWGPSEVPDVLDRAVGFLERVPGYVWSRAREGAA